MRNRRDKGREAGEKEGGEWRRKGKRKGSMGKPTKKPIANDIISGWKLQTATQHIQRTFKINNKERILQKMGLTDTLL